MATLAEIAIYLARRGWAVYPQAPQSNIPTRNCDKCRAGYCAGVPDCPCTDAVDPCHALHAATADVDLTLARWEQAPRCNPALNLGWSGLVVVDIDCHGGDPPNEIAPGVPNRGAVNGLGAFAALLEHLGQDWPEDTLTIESPTGGMHLYYRAPKALTRTVHAAWQVEVKAGATSITAPGAVRDVDRQTGTYTRVSDATEPAPFPRWLGEWLVTSGKIADPAAPARTIAMPQPRSSGDGAHSPRWWERAWRDQLDEIANAAAGTRNDMVLRRGLRLVNLTAEAGCPWTTDEAEQALIDAQHQYAANAGRPASHHEYVAVARATRQRGERRAAA